MYNITEEHIDYVLNDLKAKGIVSGELQDDLLDHICCIIEAEFDHDEDFETAYHLVVKRFYKKSLQEVQTETDNLLKFKNFYAMKKLLKISGIATVFFTSVGAIFKALHYPGAGIAIVLGGFFFSFVFLPLLIALKFRDEESKVDKAVFSFGLLLAMILSTGIIFKLMHWPFANNMMVGTTVVFTFIYVPVYFFSRIKRPNLRFNTIVNSVLMMACGGIFFSLFDLSYSHTFSKQMVKNHIYMHENSEKLFHSNERLYASNTEDGNAKSLREQTQSVNNNIEAVVAIIVKNKSTKHTKSAMQNLINSIDAYNSNLPNFDVADLHELSKEGLPIMERLNPEISINLLAQVQQRLAVNENCYLTGILSAKPV